ncbi:MAG: hypothetical protein HYS61_03130 [Acidobacteria bacterium]|nr:hypothetical protein [Acidobacteriota bacterium]
MKIPTQLYVGIGILVIGGGVLAGEYLLVQFYPAYQNKVREETLKLLPYRNDKLGIEMHVAAGLYGKVEDFAGGVRIKRPKFWSLEPTLTITSRPNPDETFEFSPYDLAKWQTQGTYDEILGYRYSRTRINNRDAVLIWRYENRVTMATARLISPERIIEANCTPSRSDEELYLQACEESIRTIKVAGPEPPPPPQPILELVPRTRASQ